MYSSKINELMEKHREERLTHNEIDILFQTINSLESLYYQKMDNETFDIKEGKRVQIPEIMNAFFDDIIKVYRKYNLSLSHEDSHGGFIVEDLSLYNIKWLRDAFKNF